MGNEKTAVDHLVERFGSVNRVAEAARRKQNSVSSWRKRGVSLDAAREIVKNAPTMGVKITLTEIFEWIEADERREKAA